MLIRPAVGKLQKIHPFSRIGEGVDFGLICKQ